MGDTHFSYVEKSYEKYVDSFDDIGTICSHTELYTDMQRLFLMNWIGKPLLCKK
jgi:hypothetical protein